jgi:hypothetical protein
MCFNRLCLAGHIRLQLYFYLLCTFFNDLAVASSQVMAEQNCHRLGCISRLQRCTIQTEIRNGYHSVISTTLYWPSKWQNLNCKSFPFHPEFRIRTQFNSRNHFCASKQSVEYWVKPPSSPNPHKTPLTIYLGKDRVLEIEKNTLI